MHLGWWQLHFSGFSGQNFHNHLPLCIYSPQSAPIVPPSKHMPNLTTVRWMIQPPLSASRHHLLSGFLDCPDILIPISLPMTALASLQSVFTTEKWPFRKKKSQIFSKSFYDFPFHLEWMGGAKSLCPLHLLNSKCSVYCFQRVPSAHYSMLLEQEWFWPPEDIGQCQSHFWCHDSGERSTTD